MSYIIIASTYTKHTGLAGSEKRYLSRNKKEFYMFHKTSKNNRQLL